MHYATAITTLICILVQVFCLVAISLFKVKHLLEEKKTQCSNAVRRIQPGNIIDSNLSFAVELKSSENIERRGKNSETEASAVANPQRENQLNTSVYNKILVEVYQISFCTIGFLISLVASVMKENVNVEETGENSIAMLYFLDLSPRILVSLVLPITIHFRNPEIRKYIFGLFKK